MLVPSFQHSKYCFRRCLHLRDSAKTENAPFRISIDSTRLSTKLSYSLFCESKRQCWAKLQRLEVVTICIHLFRVVAARPLVACKARICDFKLCSQMEFFYFLISLIGEMNGIYRPLPFFCTFMMSNVPMSAGLLGSNSNSRNFWASLAMRSR